MNPTLSYLLGRKMWWIPSVNVWGTIADFQPSFLITETDGSAKRIVHASLAISGTVQTIEFKNLSDAKANPLPQFLLNPVVVPLSKNGVPVVVQGPVGTASFVLAKSSPGDEVGLVDLLIIEMG